MSTGLIFSLIVLGIILIGIITKPLWLDKPITGRIVEKSLNDIGELFQVDIYDIFKHEPVLVEEKDGKPFLFKLDVDELGTFHELEIRKVGNDNVNLTFYSDTGLMTEQIVSFVKSCVLMYGLDNTKSGYVNEKDLSMLKNIDYFSRMWSNVWITCDSGVFEITLLGVKQNSKI